MRWNGGHAVTNEFLTPLQRAFLKHFFATPLGQRFFLTGGTALAAFHLHHRLSDDLDLFTLDDDALTEVDHQIEEMASLQAFFTSIANEMLDRLNPDLAPWAN
jgi:predicted nucleotidyltransferase component of viral defense system